MPSLRQRRQRRSRQQQQRGGRRSARRGVPSNVETIQSVDPALMTTTGGRRRGARRFSRRGVPTLPVDPTLPVENGPGETIALMNTGELVPVEEVQPGEVVSQLIEMPATGGRSRRLRRGRRASRAAQRGGRAVSLKTAVRLLRNYYAKRYA